MHKTEVKKATYFKKQKTLANANRFLTKEHHNSKN